MKATERRLRELILKTSGNVFKKSELPNNSNFFWDNGYSYVDMMYLLFNVEKEWDIEINVGDYISGKLEHRSQIDFKINTFEELIRLIERKHELTINSFKKLFKSIPEEILKDPNFDKIPVGNLGLSEKRIKIIIAANFEHYSYCCSNVDPDQMIGDFVRETSSFIKARKDLYENHNYFRNCFALNPM